MARFIAQKTLRDFLQETEEAISSGRVDVALANCQTTLASFPESLEAQRLLGEVYLAQGRLEEALHAFDWVLMNDPENIFAYCNRAIVSERMSDIDTALDCYQQAYELSRGNSQIRQKFAELSARVGQQGFVFSRAGLARLYMRGDLLSQAIQEWEVVLTATPERLDARTGRLEAYWREGSLDQVEELATQILQDVPNCEKALLLLAHTAASKDMARAQALLQQVEALDPDLVMAQELFADMSARYPDDPFLKLLEKEPCLLNNSPASNMAYQSAEVPSSVSLPQGGQVPILETSTSHSPEVSLPWENAQPWSGDATFLASFPDGDLQQNNSTPWAVDRTVQNAPSAPSQGSQPEPWEMLQNALQNAPSALSQGSQPEPWEMLQNALQNAPSALSQGSQPEPWEMLQNALHNMSGSISNQDQEQSGPQQWEDQSAVSNLNGGRESWQSQSQNLDALAESSPDSSDSWVNSVDNHRAEEANWTSTTRDQGPPSWLSMLTQADHKQMTSSIPPLEDTPSPPVLSEEVLPASQQEPVAQQSATSLGSSSWAQELEAEFSLGDDDESSFGPAWLRSLGATALEEDAPHLEQSASSVLPLSTEAEKQELSLAYALEKELAGVDQGEQPATYALEKELAGVDQGEQPATYTLEKELAGTIQEEQPAMYALEKELAGTIQEEQPAMYALEKELAGTIQEEQPETYALEKELAGVDQEEQPAMYALEKELAGVNQEEQPAMYALEKGLAGVNQEEPPATHVLEKGFEGEDQEEQSAVYALEKGLAGTIQEEPLAVYDSWKISESTTQPTVYDLWRASASEPETQPIVEPNLQLDSATFEPGKTLDSEPQPEIVTKSSENVEQDLIVTLEELEQQLHAKGFVAMEPNSLSVIAQAEEGKSTNTRTPLSARQTSQPAQEIAQKQVLPSALAELGTIFNESVDESKPVVSSALSSGNTADFPAGPFWFQELRSGSMSESDASTASFAFHAPIISRPVSSAKVSLELPNTPPVSEGATPRLKFEPTQISPLSSMVGGQAGVLDGQDVGVNPFLENELETTMKRPAVRLQSMMQSVAPRDHASSASQVRTREQGESPVSKAVESENLNYKERLLKGYQHQLVGDYDEAMQDYRLVIRGAPELLGEVISNLRALLKLAPKYSIGYRVLGDAYMHQGEYLQAMDAYNSALTMTKKARS